MAGTGSITTQKKVANIDHHEDFAEDMAALYLKEELSDAVLVVAGRRFPVHRVVLAARSEYFRHLFFGALAGKDAEFRLEETNDGVFEILLKFVYTGRVIVADHPESVLFHLYIMADRYSFVKLASAIALRMQEMLNPANFFELFEVASKFNLAELMADCLHHADRNASQIVNLPGFLELAADDLEKLVSRDSFSIAEVEIFKSIVRWLEQHPETRNCSKFVLLGHVRLALMSVKDLIQTVRRSGLVSCEVVNQAISTQAIAKVEEKQLPFRAIKHKRDVNVCPDLSQLSVPVGNVLVFDAKPRISTYKGTRTCQCDVGRKQVFVDLVYNYVLDTIVVQLGGTYWSYCYNIHTSIDGESWSLVGGGVCKDDCRKHKQSVEFEARAVKLIRVSMTTDTTDRMPHESKMVLVGFKAMLSSRVNVAAGSDKTA